MPGTSSSKVGTSSPLWFITSPFWHCSLHASHSSTSGLLCCSFLFHNPPAGTGPDCRQAGLAAGQFPLFVCRMRFGFWVTEKSNTFSKKKKRLKKLHILFSVNVALTDVVIPASLWMPALNFVPITSRMSCFQQVFDGAARQRSLCLRPSLMKRRQRRFFRSFMACSWARALISTSESCVSVMLLEDHSKGLQLRLCQQWSFLTMSWTVDNKTPKVYEMLPSCSFITHVLMKDLTLLCVSFYTQQTSFPVWPSRDWCLLLGSNWGAFAC